MPKKDPLVEQRKLKLAAWREQGFDYAVRFDRTHTALKAKKAVEKKKPRSAEEVLATPTGKIRLCGRIVNLREMGKLTFLRIRDVSGDFQICLSRAVLEDEYKKFLKLLDLGDFVGFSGEFFITKHGEPTLLATDIFPLAKSLRPLPEKFHGVVDEETRHRQRYLELITDPDSAARFKIRASVVREIRNFLESKNFMEVETRTLQSQAGGAMAKVFETHHNALDHDFVLRISLELELKMLVGGGYERVFEIGKCFRNEGIDPSHLQEFTLLEWYAAYADLQQNMEWTEEMIKTVLKNAVGETKFKVFDHEGKTVEVDFGGKWKKARFPELIKEYTGLDMHTADRKEIEALAKKLGAEAKELKKSSTGTLLDFIYKKSARPHLIQPTFVLDYPSELKPLARPNKDGTADCYQLLVAGWEIVNSYGELVDPLVQRKLLEDQAAAKAAGDEEAMDVDEDFLIAMEHGFPPMTGFGMGIDRFVALITEQQNLKETILFPLMRPLEK